MRMPLWPVHDYATAITFRDRHVLATRKQETTEAGTSLPMDALRTRTNVEFDAALRFWFRSVVLDKRMFIQSADWRMNRVVPVLPHNAEPLKR